MQARLRTRRGAYRLYVGMEFGLALSLALVYTTVVVYRVDTAGLSPLELVLVGTVLEIAYFAFQFPTGALADAVSKRLSVILGAAVLAGAFALEGALPVFGWIAAAQVVRALALALISGALEAWIADELDDPDGLGQVYLRGEQAGLIGTLVGTVLSGLVAAIGLNLPLLVAAGLLVIGTVALVVLMPETRPHTEHTGETDADGEKQGVFRRINGNTRTTLRVVRTAPALLLLFGVVAFFGAWHEGLDRLWGAYLLESFTFPPIAGVSSVMWFSAISFGATLLSLGATELIRRRSAGASPARTVKILLVLSIALMVLTTVFGLVGNFYVAIAAYWVVAALRPSYEPMITALTMARTPRNVRATVLSARDMFDATGQFVGGPAIGAIGSAFSLRAAIVSTAAALVGVVALLAAAIRGLSRAAADSDLPAEDEVEAHP